MNIFDAIESFDPSAYIESVLEQVEKSKVAFEQIERNIKTIESFQMPSTDCLFAGFDQISKTMDQTIKIISTFQHIDTEKICEGIKNYPIKAQKSAEVWSDFGWVPCLPTSKAIDLLKLKYPQSQKEADSIMIKDLDAAGINALFDELEDMVTNHSHNMHTFKEAIQCYNADLYSACVLLLFGLIDSCFIIGQPQPTPTKNNKKPRRQLAAKAVSNAINASNSKMVLFAYTTQRIIERLFMNGDDFDSSKENGLNRNFISHGMNNYIPDQTDCLKLFVLLYNIYVSFETGYFKW